MSLMDMTHCLYWPAEEAWERQTDRVSITDHTDHLEHPDVLELGWHVEAVKTVRVTARVGADALHKVRCAGLQLAHHLRKRVLEDRKQIEQAAHFPTYSFIPHVVYTVDSDTRLHIIERLYHEPPAAFGRAKFKIDLSVPSTNYHVLKIH